jgi:hypothetical protein
MTGTHPTAEQLQRYRRRIAAADELRDVDRHLASCDRCFAAVRVDADPAVALPTSHLTFDELEAYVGGSAGADDRAIIDEHAAQCAMCRQELADLQSVAEVMKGGRAPARPFRRLLAAAAILALLALGAWLVFTSRTQPVPAPPQVQRPTPPPEPPPARTPAPALALAKPPILDTLVRGEPVLRGPEKPPFALLAPVATVVLDDRPRFEWEAAPEAKSYEVAVADAQSGSVAVTGTSETTQWRADEPLSRGRTYSWQVTAHTAAGTSTVAPGPSAPEALFHVAEKVEPLPDDPRERGVALANLGALDDAERALREAAAEELLEEVRSWRTPHGRPTTTNGAQ